jgi:hypothetical protein
MGWTTKIAGQQWTAADANYLGNRINETGTLAARPASGTVGQHYEATDTLQEFRWNGTAWIVMSEPWTAWTPVLLCSASGLFGGPCVSVALSAGALYKRDNGRISLLYSGQVSNIFGQTLQSGQITICSLPATITQGIGSMRIVSSTDQTGIAQFTSGYGAINTNPAGGSIANGQIAGVRDGAGALMAGTVAAGNAVFFHFVGTTTT